MRLLIYSLLIFSFACGSHPTISSYQNVNTPYGGDVPTHTLYDHLPTKGRFIEVDQKNHQVNSGELIAVYDVGLVINEISKDLFEDNIATSFHLKLIPKDQIRQITIHDMITLHNGTIYGSVHWILYPVLTLFHGIILLYTFPTWFNIFLYQVWIGYTLTYMRVEIDEWFSFQSLVPFSRFPHHLPKSLEDQIALKSQDDLQNQNEIENKSDQSNTIKSKFQISMAFGSGAKYADAGLFGGLRYHLLNRWVIGVGLSIGSARYQNPTGQVNTFDENGSSVSVYSSANANNNRIFNKSTFSVQLGYQIDARKTLMLSGGTDLTHPYYSTYRHIGIDYLYDFGLVDDWKVLIGLTIAQPGNQLAFIPSGTLGIHYEF
jgi:hypothetical protein